MKAKEIKEVYQHKRAILSELESLSETDSIDLYYADESRASIETCVPRNPHRFYQFQLLEKRMTKSTVLSKRKNKCSFMEVEFSFILINKK